MKRKIKENTIHVSSLILSGIGTKVLTSPLERIKILMQTEHVWKGSHNVNLTKKSSLGLFKGMFVVTQRSLMFKVGERYGEGPLLMLLKPFIIGPRIICKAEPLK